MSLNYIETVETTTSALVVIPCFSACCARIKGRNPGNEKEKKNKFPYVAHDTFPLLFCSLVLLIQEEEVKSIPIQKRYSNFRIITI